MRILMLSQFFTPIIGGAERHVQDLSVELVARGHRVAVATLWQPGLPRFEVNQGVRVYRVGGLTQRMAWLFSATERRYAPPFPDVETMLALRQVIARERPEIVHAHNWLVHSFLPLKTWSGAGLVVTLHDYSLRCAKTSFTYRGKPCAGPGPAKCVGCAVEHYGAAKGIPTVLGNWMMGAVERRAVDMFVPVSQAVANGSGLDADHLPYRVAPNFLPDTYTDGSVDAPVDASDAPYLSQLPDDGYLLFVGALSRSKGIDTLLSAYGALRDAPPLVLIGTRAHDYDLSLTPSTRGRVMVFYGWPHQRVMRAWQRCGIAIVPSMTPETFSLSAAEAMVSGKPVVASRIGALPELIEDGATGLLVAPGDVGALRHAIERLLADQGLRERIGAAARRRMAAFRASAVTPRIEQIYQDVLAKRKEPQGSTAPLSQRTITRAAVRDR